MKLGGLPFSVQNLNGFVDRCQFSAFIPIKHSVRFVAINTHQFAPISNAQSYIINGYHAVLARISSLHAGRRPPTIAGLVIFVVVDPIQRMLLRRALTHVFIEILKTGLPSLTHLDAASAVARPRCISRIVASFTHSIPNRKLRRFRQSVGFHQPRCSLASQASAASGPPSSKEVASDYLDGSAVTLAQPVGILVPIGFWGSRKYQKSFKSFSSQVYGNCHWSFSVRRDDQTMPKTYGKHNSGVRKW